MSSSIFTFRMRFLLADRRSITLQANVSDEQARVFADLKPFRLPNGSLARTDPYLYIGNSEDAARFARVLHEVETNSKIRLASS